MNPIEMVKTIMQAIIAVKPELTLTHEEHELSQATQPELTLI